MTKNNTRLAIAFFVAAVWGGANSRAQLSPAVDTETGESAAAAQRFLDTLDDSQRGKVVFDFKDEEQRKRWSNLPAGIFRRAGLRMGDLTDEQRDAAMEVLEAALSTQGYTKVVEIVEADEVLNNNESGRRGPGGRRESGGPRGRGGVMFGHDNYFISFLGQPSATEPWMIQFGGHHLGLNITFVGDQGTLAPSHTGAQPAIYEFEGKTVRPLGDEVDKAFALIGSLDEAQRKQAVLGFQVRNLVLGPGRDGQMIEPEGIRGTDLNAQQREMLVDLASEWTGIMLEAVSAAKLEEMRQNIEETWFAWSGPTEEGSAVYFRIQAPTVFIEYAPQGRGGDSTNHIHTIYRDPTNEYGAKWWKE